MNPLVVNVVELVRKPAQRKHVSTAALVENVVVGDARVMDGVPAQVALDLESLSDGVVVTGRVSAAYEATCRRCLGPVTGDLAADVLELYQRHPTTEEAYPFDGELLDLVPLVREALALELPLAPLCRPDCRGLCSTCGANRNETDCGHRPDTSDLRWAALDVLRDKLEDVTGDEEDPSSGGSPALGN
ncbi:MAG TPA: DUF177 domain-containing protein [Acidimicrobiales bacterium]